MKRAVVLLAATVAGGLATSVVAVPNVWAWHQGSEHVDALQGGHVTPPHAPPHSGTPPHAPPHSGIRIEVAPGGVHVGEGHRPVPHCREVREHGLHGDRVTTVCD